jgi:hypothetical protein
LPPRAFAHNPVKQQGWNLFAGLPYRFNSLHAKISYALSHFTGQLFFRILPEAVLLTKKENNH